jgi:hypothetical protein
MVRKKKEPVKVGERGKHSSSGSSRDGWQGKNNWTKLKAQKKIEGK